MFSGGSSMWLFSCGYVADFSLETLDEDFLMITSDSCALSPSVLGYSHIRMLRGIDNPWYCISPSGYLQLLCPVAVVPQNSCL